MKEHEPINDPFADIPEAEDRKPKPLSFHMQGMGIDGPVRLFKCFVPEQDEDANDGAFYFAMNDQTGEGVISMADPADGFTLAHHFYRALVDETDPHFQSEPEEDDIDVPRMIEVLLEEGLIKRLDDDEEL